MTTANVLVSAISSTKALTTTARNKTTNVFGRGVFKAEVKALLVPLVVSLVVRLGEDVLGGVVVTIREIFVEVGLPPLGLPEVGDPARNVVQAF